MVLAGVTSLFMESIAGAWKFLIALNAGIGLVQILRWYWWRINAWSEIAAMAASFVVSLIVFTLPQTKDNFAYQMLIIVPISTLTWLVATYVTPPVSQEELVEFYERVRPNGGWWGPVARRVESRISSENRSPALVNWLLGSAFVYCALFAVGKLLLGFYGSGIIFLLIALLTGILTYRGLPFRGVMGQKGDA